MERIAEHSVEGPARRGLVVSRRRRRPRLGDCGQHHPHDKRPGNGCFSSSCRPRCRETGRQVINVEVFRLERPEAINVKNSRASPTPIVDGDGIYVHFGADGTAALTTSGRILWSTRLRLYRVAVPATAALRCSRDLNRQLRWLGRRGVCGRARCQHRKAAVEHFTAQTVEPCIFDPTRHSRGQRQSAGVGRHISHGSLPTTDREGNLAL